MENLNRLPQSKRVEDRRREQLTLEALLSILSQPRDYDAGPLKMEHLINPMGSDAGLHDIWQPRPPMPRKEMPGRFEELRGK